MIVIPAIDLLDGKAVRLHQGKYDEVTVFHDDPPRLAAELAARVRRLHVVDLEGARRGALAQEGLVREVVAAFSAGGGEVQVGGGVRTREHVEGYLAAGARWVVLGTAAVRTPELVREIARAHPDTVIIAVDAKDGLVATDGWLEVSTKRADALVRELADAPLGGVLYTDIARDGTGVGPNVEATIELSRGAPFPVIASGGVGNADHIRELAARGAYAAIVGRALYDGRLSLDDALLAAQTTARP
ncbi:MAG: 1-(5-phosphoribosyl)-5-((5-phosphoribosylamino)methylideneamino)imidazole-4-carboxamide isomerase [Myxococcales bacterium]|nr:1-(5-phosphoribosyl)-5-((5-phosphoribosylamino)methylideneamino)imidazole-4-carboxamide isomerase [Myxococcales bacterium]